MSGAAPRVIVALDRPDLDSALNLAACLDPRDCRLKVGKELFTACGPTVLEALRERGFEVFLDLKFHDIPNTVAGAVRVACAAGAWMVDVHASGGRAMLEAAVAARPSQGDAAPLLVAVTVLTSLDDAALHETGVGASAAEQVLRLALLARDCGLDGVVCSAQEASLLRRECGPDFVLVTPGIRPAAAGGDDQRRTVTPAEALRLGSDYLVIGRPVTAASDPAQALAGILSEI